MIGRAGNRRPAVAAGFTLLEVLVVVSLIALMTGLLLPALGSVRTSARQLKNSTNMRSIQQSFVLFAQSNRTGGRDGRYPGLDASGGLNALRPVSGTRLGVVADVPPPADTDDLGISDGRPNDDDSFGDFVFASLFAGGYLAPEVAASPADTTVTPFAGGGVSYDASAGVSYGLTSLKFGGGYLRAWAETGSGSELVLADRFFHEEDEPFEEYSSVWTEADSQTWEGCFTFNDGSTTYAPTAERDGLKYAAAPRFDADLAGGAQHGWGVFWEIDPSRPSGPGAMVKDIDGR